MRNAFRYRRCVSSLKTLLLRLILSVLWFLSRQ